MRSVYWLGLTYLLVSSSLFHAVRLSAPHITTEPVAFPAHEDEHHRAADWFDRARPHCNPTDVHSHLSANPVPEGFASRALHAACLALAGDVESTRRAMEALPAADRRRAALVLDGILRPVAASRGGARVSGPLQLVAQYRATGEATE